MTKSRINGKKISQRSPRKRRRIIQQPHRPYTSHLSTANSSITYNAPNRLSSSALRPPAIRYRRIVATIMALRHNSNHSRTARWTPPSSPAAPPMWHPAIRPTHRRPIHWSCLISIKSPRAVRPEKMTNNFHRPFRSKRSFIGAIAPIQPKSTSHYANKSSTLS